MAVSLGLSACGGRSGGIASIHPPGIPGDTVGSVPGDSSGTIQPPGFTPAPHRITGTVRLFGVLRDEAGLESRRRYVDGPDSVVVERMRSGRVLDRTLTNQGWFRFDDVDPGTYQIRARHLEGIMDSLTVSSGAAGLELGAIEIGSTNHLFAYPNPVRDHARIDASRMDGQQPHFRLTDARGNVVKTFDRDATVNESYLWNGRDDQGRPLPAGVYWLFATVGTRITAELFFAE